MFLSAHSVLGVTLGTPFEVLLEVKRVPRSIWRRCKVVLESSFFKSAFFEDVPNEITIFAAPRVHKTIPKSLRSCLAVAPTLFETALTLRITFFIA